MRRITIALVAIAGLSTGSVARDCAPSTSTAAEAAAGFYVAAEGAASLPALHVYEESNGIAGLQRADDRWDDTCRGLIEPDALIY